MYKHQDIPIILQRARVEVHEDNGGWTGLLVVVTAVCDSIEGFRKKIGLEKDPSHLLHLTV